MSSQGSGGHRAVMVDEVLEYLAPEPGDVIVDATLGSGGHTAAIVERVKPGGKVIGIDRDPDAIERARTRLAGQPVILINDNHARLEVILDELGPDRLRRVLGAADNSRARIQLPTGRATRHANGREPRNHRRRPGGRAASGRAGENPLGIRRGTAGTEHSTSNRKGTTATTYHNHSTTRSNGHSSYTTTGASETPSRSHEILHGVEDCSERRSRRASHSTRCSNPSH